MPLKERVFLIINQNLYIMFISNQLVVKCKTIKGTSFVGVRNYTNKFSELSNQTFLVGFSYANMLKKDLMKLTSFAVKRQVVEMFANNDKELVKKAYNELVSSLVKRTASEEQKEILRANNDATIKRSDAMSDAFLTLAKGLKLHKDTNTIHIYGLCVRKTILKQGDYPTTKRHKKTIVKNTIKKLAELRNLKYKQFKLGNKEQIILK
jgi:hypothetical protein